jgi:hypothetical protein
VVFNGDAVYVGVLELERGLSGISGEANVYYDLREAGNAYLGGGTYELSGGGRVMPVPEPGNLAVLLLVGMRVMRGRHWRIERENRGHRSSGTV